MSGDDFQGRADPAFEAPPADHEPPYTWTPGWSGPQVEADGDPYAGLPWGPPEPDDAPIQGPQTEAEADEDAELNRDEPYAPHGDPGYEGPDNEPDAGPWYGGDNALGAVNTAEAEAG